MISAAREFVRKREPKAEALVYWCFAGVFLTMPMGTSPPIILGALGALIWLLSGMAFRVKGFFRQSWTWPVLAFVALSWIGLLYTLDPGEFGLSYAGKTYYWIFCFALASLSLKDVQLRLLINAFLLGLALNACVGILQFAGVVAPRQGWFSGLTRGYNTLTVYLVLAILICAFYFKEARERMKHACLSGLMALYFFHLVIMEGRTGYLTFILLFPFFVKTLFRKLRAWKVGIAFLIIAVAILSSPIARERIELTISELSYHMSAEPSKAWGKEYTRHQDRFYYWQGAVELFLENPVIGVGTGRYPAALKARRPPDDPLVSHPHNNFLYMAASYGMLGIVVFFWLFGEVFKNGWKERDTLTGYLVFCSGLVLFVNGLFNTTILDAGTLLLLSLVVGLQKTLAAFSPKME